MTWTTASSELRTLLSDNTTDKPRIRKAVFGTANGTNKVFQTFEFRRITDFTTGSTGPLGVYVNGTKATVTSDSPEWGQFELQTAPSNTSSLEASYYIQWFLDTELTTFLQNSANWIGTGNILVIPAGLQPAALHYAASDAYTKLALKYATAVSETFRLEDSPDPKTRTPVDQYNKMAEVLMKRAETLRKQFYTRQDQNEQPLFNTVAVPVPNPMPKR